MTAVDLGMPAYAPRGVGHLRGDESFPVAAKRALADTQLRRNIGKATGTIRDKRLRVVAEVPDWEELRDAGKAMKAQVLSRLPELLEQLEERVTAAGGQVHWARDANDANRIVTELVRAAGADEVVKVKSMATQEIGLNEALEEAGIAAWETDLAELIVQLGHDKPSHILVPAIHRNRAEIREIFLREMGNVGRAPDPGLTDEPRLLANAARLHLRQKFLSARGRHQRRELRGRRDRHAVRRRVRGQRADVPDAAGHPDHRDGHREAACRPGRTSRCSCSCSPGPRPGSG